MINFLHTISTGLAKAVAIPLIFVLNLAGYSPTPTINTPINQVEQAETLGAYNPSGGGTYRLSGSIGTTNTSISLSSFKEPVSNVPYTMSYLNSDVAYGTLDPQTNVSEFIAFTGITQNSDGSALLTGVTRGLNRTNVGDSCTASTTFRQPHSGQSIFILSNAPCLYGEYVTKRNNETITGIKTFASTSIPRLDAAHTYTTGDELKLVTYGQLASTSFSGAVDASVTAKGLVELATRAEAAAGAANGSGNTTAALALASSIATSTCQVATSSVIVSSSTTGKLSTSCFDFTQNYTFTGTNAFATTTVNGINVAPKFGGTGADGALSITSGTTTIALGSANVVVKNYTSISITGTGVLNFSGANTNGTLVILKSQGNVTISSTASGGAIQVIGMGGGGGAAGNDGTDALSPMSFSITRGRVGTTSAGGAGGTATPALLNQGIKALSLAPGAGGGSGDNETSRGGAGGAGGGALYLEVAGAYSFSGSTINASGVNGVLGTTGGTGGSGAGGGAGSIAVLYNSLSVNSGTYLATGGAGAAGASGGGGGAGGLATIGATSTISSGGAGSVNGSGGGGGGGGAGRGGSSGSAGAGATNQGAGGGGAGGSYYVAQNTEF